MLAHGIADRKRTGQAQARQPVGLGHADLGVRRRQFPFAGSQVRTLAQQIGRNLPNVEFGRLGQLRRSLAEHVVEPFFISAGQGHQALEQHLALALLPDQSGRAAGGAGVGQRRVGGGSEAGLERLASDARRVLLRLGLVPVGQHQLLAAAVLHVVIAYLGREGHPCVVPVIHPRLDTRLRRFVVAPQFAEQIELPGGVQLGGGARAAQACGTGPLCATTAGKTAIDPGQGIGRIAVRRGPGQGDVGPRLVHGRTVGFGQAQQLGQGRIVELLPPVSQGRHGGAMGKRCLPSVGDRNVRHSVIRPQYAAVQGHRAQDHQQSFSWRLEGMHRALYGT